MSDLQFPHSSVRIVDENGRWTREGLRFEQGIWKRVGSGESPVINSAVSGTAGATYTATEQQIINDLVSLVNQMRQVLINNGLMQ